MPSWTGWRRNSTFGPAPSATPRPRLHLQALDDAIASAAAMPPGQSRDDVVLGLVGIRLGFFPDAAEYAPPLIETLPVLEHAA